MTVNYTTPTTTGHDSVPDVEKQDLGGSTEKSSQEAEEKPIFGADFFSKLTVKDGEVYEVRPEGHSRWYQRLLDAGVEENGIKPVPVGHRTVTQYSDLFTVFFTCLLNILP